MRIPSALLFTLALPAVAMSQNRNDAAVKTTVTALTDSLFAAAGRADITAVMAFFGDKSLHADDGDLHTKAELTATYTQLYAKLQRMTFARTRTEVEVLSPTAAIVVTEGSVHQVPKDTTAQITGRGAWTLVWQRVGDRWTVLHMHQSLPPTHASTR